MKKNNLRKILFWLFYWPSVFKENRRLRTKVQDIAKYRNNLLNIIATNNHITDITGYEEPLFIASKSFAHSLVFNIYNYNPEKLASAKVTLNDHEWQLADIEIPEHTPDSLKAILMSHIEKERKLMKVMGSL